MTDKSLKSIDLDQSVIRQTRSMLSQVENLMRATNPSPFISGRDVAEKVAPVLNPQIWEALPILLDMADEYLKEKAEILRLEDEGMEYKTSGSAEPVSPDGYLSDDQ